MSRIRFAACAAALALGAASCVSYRPLAVAVPDSARCIPSLPERDVAFDRAVRLLVQRNAELRRLRAEAAAVNTEPGPRPLAGKLQVVDGDVGETMIGTELLALFGIGPRRAERALARAVRDERILAHHERARELVAELAEAWAVDAILRSLTSPRPHLEIEAFERAGLASSSSLAAAQAAMAQARAEEVVVATDLEDTRREIARLLGASPESPVLPVVRDGAWPAVPAPDARALLYARGDLLRARAAFVVADRQLRLAVQRQWPDLGVFVGGNVSLEAPMQTLAVSLPLAAPAEARAMARAREAARLRFDETVLDALHDAKAARNLLEAAVARREGAAARRRAASALVEAAAARMETDPDRAFADAVLASLAEVHAATTYREAAVDAARARVRAALAAGWPTQDLVCGEYR